MPSREAFIYIPQFIRAAFYVASLLSVLIFITGLYFRLSIWRQGREETSDLTSGRSAVRLILMGLRYFFSKECLLAKRVMIKSKLRGVMLIFLYWGFTVLFIGTVIVGIDHYLKFNILQGTFYLFFSLLLDLSGLLVLIGSAFFIFRRIFSSRELVSDWDDLPILIILTVVVLSGFSVEGVRLAISSPPLKDLSPVGAVFALILKPLGIKSYIIFWSFHILSALFFIAFIPFSKQFHMFAAPITTQDALYRRERLRVLVHD